jgi:hypothetical protein
MPSTAHAYKKDCIHLTPHFRQRVVEGLEKVVWVEKGGDEWQGGGKSPGKKRRIGCIRHLF